MFKDIKADATTNKVGTAIISASVAGGIIYGMFVRKSGFWGTFGYALGFGLAGLAVSTAVAQATKKA